MRDRFLPSRNRIYGRYILHARDFYFSNQLTPSPAEPGCQNLKSQVLSSLNIKLFCKQHLVNQLFRRPPTYSCKSRQHKLSLNSRVTFAAPKSTLSPTAPITKWLERWRQLMSNTNMQCWCGRLYLDQSLQLLNPHKTEQRLVFECLLNSSKGQLIFCINFSSLFNYFV